MRALLVEDNDNDALLIREALSDAAVNLQVERVGTGADCLKYLRKEGEYAGTETVHVVLLDLNLPDMTGAEVLQQIIASEKLQHTPVVVVSTSDDQKDVLEMYRLRCNSYVVKPSNFDDYVQTLRTIFEYWSTVMVLPDPDGLESPGLVNPAP